jgi:hypothetical protein
MSFVCLLNLLGQFMPTTTVQDANSIRGMSRCTRDTKNSWEKYIFKLEKYSFKLEKNIVLN